MTDERDPTPGELPDDTGMRDLLAGLGGPRTMPPELVARIEASLADERSRRTSGSTVVPLDTARRRRGLPGFRVVAGVAAAAAVVVGGGLVATQGLRGDLSAADTQGGGAAADGEDAARGEPPQDSQGESAALSPSTSPFALTISEHAYSRATLERDLRTVLASQRGRSMDQMTSESPMLGPITTPAGAQDCLGRLGHGDRRAVAVDVGTFDGEPGFVVVGERRDERQAWVVRTGCELIYPDAYDVP